MLCILLFIEITNFFAIKLLKIKERLFQAVFMGNTREIQAIQKSYITL